MSVNTGNPVEVSEPILNSPFDEPAHYWYIREGEEAQLRDGRRKAIVFRHATRRTSGIPLTEHFANVKTHRAPTR